MLTSLKKNELENKFELKAYYEIYDILPIANTVYFF